MGNDRNVALIRNMGKNMSGSTMYCAMIMVQID